MDHETYRRCAGFAVLVLFFGNLIYSKQIPTRALVVEDVLQLFLGENVHIDSRSIGLAGNVFMNPDEEGEPFLSSESSRYSTQKSAIDHNTSEFSHVEESASEKHIGHPSTGNRAGTLSNSHDTESNSTFAACMLILDDNHRLVEWIAYHYYALKLRTLVLLLDPYSTELPQKEVLDRWQGLIHTIVWNETDIFTNRQIKSFKYRKNETPEENHRRHQDRQTVFMKSCARFLRDDPLMRQRNVTWTAFIDSDEYLAINGELVKNVQRHVSRPGHVHDFFHNLRTRAEYAGNQTPHTHITADGDKLDTKKLKYRFGNNKTCMILPRTLYGTTESSAEAISQDVPPRINPMRFDTLRWRHRTQRSRTNGLGKALADVSRLSDDDLDEEQFYGSAHRPFRSCKSSNAFVRYELPIGIRHYLGSYEQFFYRNDVRNERKSRSSESWRKRGSGSAVIDDDIRPWMYGLLKMMSNDTIRFEEQLGGAGLPSNSSGLQKTMSET